MRPKRPNAFTTSRTFGVFRYVVLKDGKNDFPAKWLTVIMFEREVQIPLQTSKFSDVGSVLLTYGLN